MRGKFVSILDYELFLNSFHVRDHFHYEGILELVKIFTWFSSELSRAVFSIKSGAKVYCVLIANEDPVLYFGLVRDSEWVEEWLAIYESETPALIAKTDFAVTAPMQGA